MNKTLIQNALIYDGTGGDPYSADLLIVGDKIEKIAPGIPVPEGAEVVDAAGRMVTPGFVDMHRHADLALLFPDFGDIELAQGITSIGVGMCGFSLAPHKGGNPAFYNMLKPTHGPAFDDELYPTMQDYINRLRKTEMAVNATTLQGLSPIRILVKGLTNTSFTQEELEKAHVYVQEAIDAGVPGFTTGLVYQPEIYNTTEDMVGLLAPCKGKDLLYMPHMRNEAFKLPEAVAESIHIAKSAEMALAISHFKALGPNSWGVKLAEAIDLIEKERANGMDITVDFYPYHGTSTTMTSLLPASFVGGNLQAALSTITKPESIDNLRKEMIANDSKGEIPMAFRWTSTLISSVATEASRKYVGKTIKQNTEEFGFADEVEFVAHILGNESGRVAVVGLSIDEKDIATIAKLPYSMVISDALYDTTGTPHPRLYGSFPRVIKKYVLEDNVLTMQEAIKKMSSMPAKRFKMEKRGELKEGYYADVLIFDPKNVADHATFDNPKVLSTGIDYAYVNGTLAWKDQKVVGKGGISLL